METNLSRPKVNVRVLRYMYMSIVVGNKQIRHVLINLATCLISPQQDTSINIRKMTENLVKI